MKPIVADSAGEASRRRGKEGFTLVEVIIALILLVIVMIPISRLAYMSIYSTEYAKDMGEAMALAQAKLEEFEESTYSSIASGSEVNGDYRLAWTVTTPTNGVKRVDLSVAWTIASIRTNSVDITTAYVD